MNIKMKAVLIVVGIVLTTTAGVTLIFLATKYILAQITLCAILFCVGSCGLYRLILRELIDTHPVKPTDKPDHLPDAGKKIPKWEYFNDESFFQFWTVRRIGDTNFNSQQLFRVYTEEEAQALVDLLNSK